MAKLNKYNAEEKRKALQRSKDLRKQYREWNPEGSKNIVSFARKIGLSYSQTRKILGRGK